MASALYGCAGTCNKYNTIHVYIFQLEDNQMGLLKFDVRSPDKKLEGCFVFQKDGHYRSIFLSGNK
jgi:hypothetical protein